MQEENLDRESTVSVEDLFLASQETYAQAQQRAQEENKAFARTEFFRMDKLGVYRLRVMPIAPSTDGVLARPGYEFPVHQLLLELEKPSTGGKASYLYVTVPRATDAGYPLDLIDSYRRAAVADAKAQGDGEARGRKGHKRDCKSQRNKGLSRRGPFPLQSAAQDGGLPPPRYLQPGKPRVYALPEAFFTHPNPTFPIWLSAAPAPWQACG